MQILIFSDFILWPYHFETEMEIARKHLDRGDEVHFLICESSMKSCETNLYHFFYNCTNCILFRNHGLDLLNIPDKNRHHLAMEKFHREYNFPVFNNINELKAFNINGIDIGAGVASALITIMREPQLDTRLHANLLSKLLTNAMAVYESVRSYLNEFNPDLFYIYNGRFATVRPALRAAQSLGIKTLVHERGGELNSYYLSENAYTYQPEYTREEIEKLWAEAESKQESENIADSWFTEKKEVKDSYAFVKYQERKKLPENFNPEKRNIAIFNSSHSERASMGIWDSSLFEDQNEAIKYIAETVTDSSFHFYVRMHPNLKDIFNSQTNGLYNLKLSNLTVISPEDNIDSYALLENCEKVVTFGSRMGIEAVFWDKPSILVGGGLYSELKACYIPGSREELADMVRKPLTPLPKTGALKFAFWEKTRGIPFEFYRPEKTGRKISGTFSGTEIRPENTMTLINEKSKKEIFKIAAQPLPENIGEKIAFLHYLRSLIRAGFWDKEEQTVLFQKIKELENSIDIKVTACIISNGNAPAVESCIRSVLPVSFEVIVFASGFEPHIKAIAEKYGKFYHENYTDCFELTDKVKSYVKDRMLLFIDAASPLSKELQENFYLLILRHKKENYEPFFLSPDNPNVFLIQN